MNSFKVSKKLTKGAALVTILVFGAIFTSLLIILVGAVTSQERSLRDQLDEGRALQIAESGLEYIRWYLAHNPQDYNGWQNVAKNDDGAYVFSEDYPDPITGEITGEINYEVIPEEFCGLSASAKITVEGVSNVEGENYVIQQVHAKDTAANYSYIYNENVNAGADRKIRGRYHSNATVQMNGINDSVVSSSQTNGVYGNPVNPLARQDLWQDEVGTIDFNALSLDLGTIKTAADTYNGSPVGDGLDDRLFTKTSYCYDYNCRGRGNNRGHGNTCTRCVETDGFEVELVVDDNSDQASIKVWELSDLMEVPRSNAESVREKYCGNGSSVDFSDYDDADHDIEPIPTCDDGRETFLGTFALDQSCPVAFFEGDVFLHGTTDSKLLIAAADLDSIDESSVYLFNTIDYQSYDGSDGLTVVAEKDIKIPYSVPDDMGIRGIFIAQSGRYGRDNYGGTFNGQGWYRFDDRDFLQTVGSIISYEGGGTQWATQAGNFVSGFRNRENYYDRSLARRPPPLTPSVSENYSYIEWRDQQNQ